MNLACSSKAVKLFSDRISRLSVAEVAQTFGHSVQTAESLGDFRYEILSGVAPHPQPFTRGISREKGVMFSMVICNKRG